MKDFVLCIKTEDMVHSQQVLVRAARSAEAVEKAKARWGENTKVLVLDSFFPSNQSKSEL